MSVTYDAMLSLHAAGCNVSQLTTL